MPWLYCPRCGAENEEGQTYCFFCREALALDGPGERRGRQQKVGTEVERGFQEAEKEGESPWEVTRPGVIWTEQPRPLERKRRWRRRPIITGLAIVGGLAAGAIGTTLVTQLFWPRNTSQLIISRKPSAPTTPATQAPSAVRANERGHLMLPGRNTLLQLSWHPASSRLAAHIQGTAGKRLYCWDKATGKFTHFAAPSMTSGIQSLAWDPTGALLALGTPGSIVADPALAGAYPEKSLSMLPFAPQGAYPLSLAWEPGGQRLLYTLQQQVFRWQAGQSQPARVVYNGHQADPRRLVPGTYVGLWLSPDGKYVASTSNLMTESADGTNNDSQILNPLHIWRLDDGEVIIKIMAPANGFPHLQWSPDSRYLVYGNNIQGLAVYDVLARQGVLTRRYPYPGLALLYAPMSAWLMGGRYLALPQYTPVGADTFATPVLQVLEVATGRVLYTLEDYRYPIALATSGNLLAVAYLPTGPASRDCRLVWHKSLRT